MPKAKLKDITLYYEVYGEGFPVLLIAGLGSDNSSWLGVTRQLRKRFQVIVFDNRGSGRSDIPDKQYSIRDMAEDAIKLLDHLNKKKCHVIGHSMGGYIAQYLAIYYPERISKIVLEATAPVSSVRNNSLFNDFLSRLRNNGDMESWFRQWTFWLFSPKTFNRKTFIETFIKNVLQYPYLQPAVGFKRQIGAIASFNVSGRLKDIKAKAIIVTGKDDILIYPEESNALINNIRNSSSVTIENAAHSIHLENPEGFIRAVTDFLCGNKKNRERV